MNVDFALIIVLLTLASGVLWGVDALLLAPRRRAAVEALGPEPDPEALERAGRPSALVEQARAFFPVLLVVLVLRSFLVEPFKIPSGSMMPTLLVNDFILVNKFDYGLRLPVLNTKFLQLGEPRRGDVVVFRYPEDPSVPFIKRVIGVPGDRVLYRNRHLFVNGERVETSILGPYEDEAYARALGSQPLVLDESLGEVGHRVLIDPDRPPKDADLVVPPGHYFVMGDNRDNSKDSRFWGTVPDENLIGRAFVVWMNFGWRPLQVDWSRFGVEIR